MGFCNQTHTINGDNPRSKGQAWKGRMQGKERGSSRVNEREGGEDRAYELQH